MDRMQLHRTIVAVVALASVVTKASADCPRTDSPAIALANEGDALRSMNLDEAIDRYVRASHLAPTNTLILWKLATAYKKKEAWEDVARTLVFATKLAPAHADYFHIIGYAESKLARWADAKVSLEEAVKLDPGYADPHFDLAGVLLHLGNDQAALAEYTKAIQLEPTNVSFYASLADLYLRLRFFDHAEQTANAGLSWGTGAATFPLHSRIGSARTMKGDRNGAISAFEAAKTACGACTERGQQVAYFNVGAAYALLDPPRPAEAIMNLTTFTKMICRGGGAARYADECTQTQELMRQLVP